MRIKLAAGVKSVLDILHAKGFEAYIVGGCVRDYIIGKEPADWDVATSADPVQVKKIFHRTIDTGIEHGTVTVMIGGKTYEVTTYRNGVKACGASSYRNDESLCESRLNSSGGMLFEKTKKNSCGELLTLQEDLLHRDFTVNAMAYNEEEGLIDLYGGMKDIQRKVLRCTGDAAGRFAEDPLRVLRAVRFSAQLGYAIDPETMENMRKAAPALDVVSAERICMELTKILCSPRPEYLKTAYETGITAVVLPEFDRMMETEQHNPHHFTTVGEHTLKVLKMVSEDRVLRFAALFHDAAKPDVKWTDETGRDHFSGHDAAGAKKAAKIMKRLKMDNFAMDRVRKLVFYHDWRFPAVPQEVRKAASVVGKELFPYLLQLQYADVMGQSDYKKEEKIERIRKAADIYQDILKNGDCLTVKELAVTGKDLAELGVMKGPKMGECLRAALELVLEDPDRNTKEELTGFVKKNYL